MTGRLHWPGAVCHPAGSRQKKARPATCTAPGYPWPWPGAASPHPLGRLTPKRSAGTPSAPLQRPAGAALTQPDGAGGGAPGHPRHGISSAKNGSADFGGLKIDPTKSTSLPFLHQKVRHLFLGRCWKITAIERILRKIFTKNMRGVQNLLPPPFPVRVLTRAPLGGGAISSPPSRFLAISSKPMQVSAPNLQYPLSQQLYTLCENFKVQGIIVWSQMTSEWRHVPQISTENKRLRESPPRVQF